MTMHLEGPWLTTTGKIRSKRRKFASAEAAARDRELRAEWQQRQQEWAKATPHFATQPSRAVLLTAPRISPQYPPGREPQQHIPSRPDTPGAVAARAPDKVYTGTKIKGIGTMHKSNAVPVFSDDEAREISSMRR
jgi:hypothetical protein